jgi:hypothetical protein
MNPDPYHTGRESLKFAERKLERPIIPLVLALSMEPRAEQQMRALGMKYGVRSVL